jgi:hypothetical protein
MALLWLWIVMVYIGVVYIAWAVVASGDDEVSGPSRRP